MPVYFIQAGEGGPIKIGFSENIALRLNKMQADNHQKLHVLAAAPGGRELEARIHKEFSKARLAGEWFRPIPGLLSYLEMYSPWVAPKRPPRMPDTPLGRWLAKKDITAAEFAVVVGCSGAAMSRALNGKVIPRRQVMSAIIAGTNGEIQPNNFFEAAPCS